MAGGEGVRLRPLTQELPKPMAPFFGRPVMAWTLDLLRRHGILDASIACAYRHEAISGYFGNGTAEGLRLTYCIETQPLGTAGCVKAAATFLREDGGGTFLVMSGDGLTDMNLTEAIAFHKQAGALATMLVKRVERPLAYGVVLADASGRIERFIEKPGWSRAYADTVNTSIYIFEDAVLDEIPDGVCDFGKQLFPAMVARGAPVYAAASGYWCDIGDPASYLAAHADVLNGAVKLALRATRHDQVWLEEGVSIGHAQVDGPSYIGRNSRIEDGAHIGAMSIIGEDCHISGRVERSVLWHDVCMEGETDRAIIMNDAHIAPSARVLRGAVVGARARVGVDAIVVPSARIAPDTRIEDATLAGTGASPPETLSFTADSAYAQRQFFTPALAAELGASWALALHESSAGKLAIAHGGTPACAALAQSSLSGARWHGADTASLGALSLAETSRCARVLAMQGTAHIAAGQTMCGITFLDASAAPLSTTQRIERAFLAGELPVAEHQPREALVLRGARIASAQLRPFTHNIKQNERVTLFACDEPMLRRVAQRFADAGVSCRMHACGRTQASVNEGVGSISHPMAQA